MKPPQPSISQSSRLILRAYLIAAVGGSALYAFMGIGGAGIGFFGLIVLFLGFVVISSSLLVLAVIHALRDLLRRPDLRTAANIGITVAGVVGLSLGVWALWYSASRGSPCFWCG